MDGWGGNEERERGRANSETTKEYVAGRRVLIMEGRTELSCDDFHTCFFRGGETGTGIGTEIETETGREKKDPDTNGERRNVRWLYCSGIRSITFVTLKWCPSSSLYMALRAGQISY